MESKTLPKLATTAAAVSPRVLLWLALGTFAIGTEGFMIAPLLPGIADDLLVSVVTAGQLVTVFALAYALSSPILTAWSGAINRKHLLIASMAAFTLANIVAWAATGYWTLMFARILLAFSAGLYVPSANAVASAVVAPEKRGRALAIINGGTTIAIAIGVPLGATIGHALGWRMTFAGVALLAALATAGLSFGLPRGFGSGFPVATIRERIAAASQWPVLAALLVTTLWATGAYAIYTYLSLYLVAYTTLSGAAIGGVLFLWGISAAMGVFLGGTLTDKLGHARVITPTLTALTLAFASLTLSALFLPHGVASATALAAIVLCGVSAWAFYPAQQSRLISIAGMKAAPIALSLNASFMYIGFSLGAFIGGMTLKHGAPSDLGWVGALCEFAAIALLLVSSRVFTRARSNFSNPVSGELS